MSLRRCGLMMFDDVWCADLWVSIPAPKPWHSSYCPETSGHYDLNRTCWKVMAVDLWDPMSIICFDLILVQYPAFQCFPGIRCLWIYSTYDNVLSSVWIGSEVGNTAIDGVELSMRCWGALRCVEGACAQPVSYIYTVVFNCVFFNVFYVFFFFYIDIVW